MYLLIAILPVKQEEDSFRKDFVRENSNKLFFIGFTIRILFIKKIVTVEPFHKFFQYFVYFFI